VPKLGLRALHAPPGGPWQVRDGLAADGRKKVGVFVRLKNSARNSKYFCSVK